MTRGGIFLRERGEAGRSLTASACRSERRETLCPCGTPGNPRRGFPHEKRPTGAYIDFHSLYRKFCWFCFGKMRGHAPQSKILQQEAAPRVDSCPPPVLWGKKVSHAAACGQRLCLWNPPPFEKGGRKLFVLHFPRNGVFNGLPCVGSSPERRVRHRVSASNRAQPTKSATQRRHAATGSAAAVIGRPTTM